MELLKLSSRKEHGKNQVDKLRAEGIVPGVIYGKDRDCLLYTSPSPRDCS